MDDTTSLTYAELQARVRELERDKAGLVSEKESLLRIATQAVHALTVPEHAVPPEGLWIQPGDDLWMNTVEKNALAQSQGTTGEKSWVWHKVSGLLSLS